MRRVHELGGRPASRARPVSSLIGGGETRLPALVPLSVRPPSMSEQGLQCGGCIRAPGYRYADAIGRILDEQPQRVRDSGTREQAGRGDRPESTATDGSRGAVALRRGAAPHGTGRGRPGRLATPAV